MTTTRKAVDLPFGAGLDRDSGPLAGDPKFQEDLRNAHLTVGMAFLRKGSRQTATFAAMTDVLAGRVLKVQSIGVCVAWDEATGEVHVFRVTGSGESPVNVGLWFTCDPEAQQPPRIFMAEVGGRMFLAHDEPAISRRAPTVEYTPATVSIAAITAAWAHEDGIRFRGVTAHLGQYLCGWGYGTEAEPSPHFVRMSLPGQPDTFQLQHYEPIGQEGDPVLRVLSTGQTLLCYKAFETWEHFGTNRHNFGKRQLDLQTGIVASRLGIEVETEGGGANLCFSWSHQGPRVSSGGAPVDLSTPLQLLAPNPADLTADGPASEGFAAYLATRKQVRFHFGQLYYAYDLDSKQWSYGEMAYEPTCAFLLPGIAPDAVAPGVITDLVVLTDVETP